MNYKRISIATTVIVLSVVMLVSSATFAAADAVKNWLAANAVRLDTVEAGHGFADMQPLRKIIGDARIVSLGEATHGTREFFQLKHRMLEFLATEMGFTIFSIEANMPEAYRLNDYVLKGNGDPAKLIKGMYFWTWDTQEVLDMVLWMREFNKSGKGRVQFTGFDMQTPTVAAGIVRDFVASADPKYAASVLQAIPQATRAAPGSSAWGSVTATFPVKDAAGKRVRFSGYIKTEGVTAGQALLWWQVDGPSGVMGVRNRGVTGTTDWKRYHIDIPVAADAEKVQFGARIGGNGTAWFDGLTIELDGKPYLDKSAFDLDFESSTPRGFETGSSGFAVQLDPQVFHKGKQSVRMTKAVDPTSSTWKEIVRHLEASREAYAKKGTAARDIEWVIQNARVVLQCLQMREGEVMRDRSMADNVKWILDNNPGAKIVLWAHNGHVATASAEGAYGYDPMGVSLRKMFGDKMVVFGFAFNQGSFQAVGLRVASKPSKPGRPVFNVGPAPEGSLDAMLASAGLRIAAIDLRALPKEGQVAKWFSEPRATRSIGAAYSESAPGNYFFKQVAPKSYDALLFVEKTTAARPLAAVAAVGTPLAVRDGKKPKEIKGWGTVTDPDGDCTFKEDKGKLTITVPGNLHDLHEGRGMNAPRVLREVEGDFTATVKVTFALTPGKGVAKGARTAGNYAGLLLWGGEKDYIRLERNARWGGGKLVCFTPLFAHWKERMMKEGPPGGGAADFFKGDSTWFKLERKGGRVTAGYSHDGKEWAVAKEVDTELPKKLHIGVAAINSSDTPFTVEFGELKVEASK